MNVDLRDGRSDYALEWARQQLQRLSAVEPPRRLKEKLLAAVPCPVTSGASARRAWWWPRATGWVGVAATITILCSVVWLHAPANPSPRPSVDANSSLSRVLAIDYNSVRPMDTNTFDSNGLY